MTSDSMRIHKQDNDGFPGWWFVIFAYLSVALFFGSKYLLTNMLSGGSVPNGFMFFTKVSYWLFWLILSPVIIWFARRYRFQRGRLWLSIGVHLLLAMILAPLHFIAWKQVSWLLFEHDLLTIPAEIAGDLKYGLIAGSFTGFYKYWLVIGIYCAFDYYNRHRKREQETALIKLKLSRLDTQLSTARLQALKAQIHPHMIFNTLNTISVLMKEDVNGANEMLVKFSVLFREILKAKNEQLVPLGKELETLSLYLDLEKVRFADRITIRIDVDDKARSALVPVMLLQPLVENSLRHGIGPKTSGGELSIAAHVNNGSLHISVADTGVGIQATSTDGKNGIGLKNTVDRLDCLYGKRYRFTIDSRADKGTAVKIEIPYQQRNNDG